MGKYHLLNISIFVSLILCTVFPMSVFGEGESCVAECRIKDGTPENITEYLNSVKTVLTNVKAGLPTTKKTGAEKKRSSERIQRDLTRIYNLFGNWEGYYSSFEFYVTMPLSQSVPSPVKRDHEILVKEVDGLSKFLESLTKRGYQDTVIEDDVCQGLEGTNCNFKGATSGTIVGLMMKDLKNMLEMYRLSILGKNPDTGYVFLFAHDDFKPQFVENYNSFTNEKCSRCKGEFTEKAQKSMGEISSLNKWSKNGTQRWIDAWNMLIGNRDQVQQQNEERAILEQELSKQGLSTDNSQIVLGNLDRYNNQGQYSIDNNFISNTFNTTSNNIGTQANAFKESLQQKFEKEGTDSVPNEKLIQTEEDVQNTQDLGTTINSIYQVELPFAAVQDTVTESLQAKLIKYHLSLVEVIGELDKIIPTSEKVCNDQANGLGKCSY